MRKFRVVAVLDPQHFTRCFSIHGALMRPHKGEIYRSLRAAEAYAQQCALSGWCAFIVRRTRTGWAPVVTAAPTILGEEQAVAWSDMRRARMSW
jgi:hypothetical protein